jgi:ribonuclease HI
MQDIIVYSDGSSLGNPGPGGWAAILIYNNKRKELSGGYNLTTNNRMELLAVINALKALKSSKYKIKLYTDSRLIVDSINKGWLKNWASNNWKKSDKKSVLNKDLWEELYKLLKQFNVEFNWVAGHKGIVENERCDELCKLAAQNQNKLDDINYIKNLDNE